MSRSVATAMEPEKAYAYLRKEDKRPILILRECLTCNGTDDALLSREDSNEKTFIMARWFHCVKMPVSVLEMNHPFHNLFDGENPPHLFVADADGGNPVILKGDQAQGELWKAMNSVLKRNYKKDPNKAIKNILKLHIEFDKLDAKEDQLAMQLERELSKGGPNSRKAKKLRQEIDKVGAERDKALEREKKLYELDLKAKDKDEESVAQAGAR